MTKDEQQQLCHPELVSGSCKSVGEKILNRVQNDNVAEAGQQLCRCEEVPEARQHSCHPEFISGSKTEKMLKQLTASPTHTSSQGSCLACSFCKVQHDRNELSALKKQAAFTLAEVLITLGIIGIVAAMTIPTLIKSYEKKVTETKVKQSFSMLAQAIKMSVAENGEMSGWEFPQNSIESQETFMNTYILPYLKTISYCDKKGTGKSMVLPCKGIAVSSVSVEYILSNGVTASFSPVAGANRIAVLLNTNINNSSSNTPGKDWFYFSVKNNVVYPDGYRKNLTREEILAGYEVANGKYVYACKSKRGGNPTYRYACTALFYIDGMRFAPDYPW